MKLVTFKTIIHLSYYCIFPGSTYCFFVSFIRFYSCPQSQYTSQDWKFSSHVPFFALPLVETSFYQRRVNKVKIFQTIFLTRTKTTTTCTPSQELQLHQKHESSEKKRRSERNQTLPVGTNS